MRLDSNEVQNSERATGLSSKNKRNPVQVCQVAPGQRVTKLTEKQTAEMIKQANKKPAERVAETDKVRHVLTSALVL